MKLAMLLTEAGLKPVGVNLQENNSQYVDLCAIDNSLPNSIHAILQQTDGLQRAAMAMATGLEKQVFVDGKLQAPITAPEKVLCIGLNYIDHARETNSEIPSEPICFGKYANTIVGPEDAIVLPEVSNKVDYEAEMVAVIGKPAKNVSEENALDYVAGYMVGHDVSARDWQKGRPGGQWLLGKSPDTFAPIGPYLVTSDEVGDPHQLKISLTLNGETMQDGSTSDLIFKMEQLIAHLTKLMTLQPGDLIFTGTPAGVGMARTPAVFLKPGDRVEVTVEKLGTLGNSVVGA